MKKGQTFNPSDWHKLGNWPVYLLGPEFWFGKNFSEEYLAIFGKRPKVLFYFDGKTNHQFLSKQDVTRLKKNFRKEKAKKFFLDLRDDFYRNRAMLFSRKKEFEKLDSEKRLDYLVKMIFPIYSRNAVYDWIAFLYEQLYHDEIYNEYKNIRGDEVTQEFPKLITPSIETETLNEQIAILQRAQSIKESKDIKESAKTLAKRFGYLPIFHMGDPHDENWYVNSLEKVTKEQSPKEIKDEIQNLRNSVNKAKKEQANLTKEIKLSLELQSKIEILRICAEIRTLSDEFVSTVGLMFRKIFKPLADFFGLRYQELFLLKSSEIVKLYQDKKLDKKIIEERKKFFVAYPDDSFDLEIKTGDEARILVSKFTEPEEAVKEKKIIRGLAACPGKVEGIVHKITGSVSKEDFKEGEILVVPLTTVEFVPVMKKASAIVTDQGGLTSHAAIVSRELGTPCIVGTKIATKVLKDGDEVEVDAEKGVVKILKRAK